jgi:hypothetical protein
MRQRKQAPQVNARTVLPGPLIQRCLLELGERARQDYERARQDYERDPSDYERDPADTFDLNVYLRVTVKRDGSPSPSEKRLSDELRDECRQALAGHSPIRLYFPLGTKQRKRLIKKKLPPRVRGAQQGRPRLPHRKIASRMVEEGHRVEVVAAYLGTRRQTLKHWGIKQSVPRLEPISDPEEFERLYQLGIDHLSDAYGRPVSVEDIVYMFGYVPETCRTLIARVGLLVESVTE